MSYQSSSHHSFDVKIAMQLGSVELAIIVHHFQYWINKNQSLERNFIEGRTWSYQTREEIAACFPCFSSDQVRRFTDKLVKLKILRKANFNKLGLDKTIWYAFENEEMFTIGKSAKSIGKSASSIGKSARAIPKSIPKSISSYSIDLGQETEACFRKKENTLDASRRWKLTAEQYETFLAVKHLNITDDKGNLISDSKIAFWSKTHSLQRILDVYHESKHHKANSLRAYMSKLLDEDKVVNNANIQANSQFAKDFMRQNKWYGPKIFKKYMKIPFDADYFDVNFNMPQENFIYRLIEIYEKCKSK